MLFKAGFQETLHFLRKMHWLTEFTWFANISWNGLWVTVCLQLLGSVCEGRLKNRVLECIVDVFINARMVLK